MSGKVWLEGMVFHAFHGVHSHEKEQGNTFEVDIGVEVDITTAADSDKLEDAVDYEMLYEVVRKEMEKPSYLLEAVGGRIIHAVFGAFPGVREVELRISKRDPPIANAHCRKATVHILTRRP